MLIEKANLQSKKDDAEEIVRILGSLSELDKVRVLSMVKTLEMVGRSKKM
jgi:hypothetical protein